MLLENFLRQVSNCSLSYESLFRSKSHCIWYARCVLGRCVWDTVLGNHDSLNWYCPVLWKNSVFAFSFGCHLLWYINMWNSALEFFTPSTPADFHLLSPASEEQHGTPLRLTNMPGAFQGVPSDILQRFPVTSASMTVSHLQPQI